MPLWLGLIALVIAGFLLFALCVSLIYWYETLNSPDGRIPSPAPGLAACLHQYGASLCGYIACSGLFICGPLLRRAVKGDKDARPVVCIHGLNNNAAVWLRLARRMDAAGYAVSSYSYGSLFVPLERIIAGLDAHMAEVEAAHPGRKPVFVCHSLGGLLARHWLALGDNSERVAGLLTLGTPHGGSKLAVLAPGALAKNLVPGSFFLATLAVAPPLPFPCVALVSPADEAVLPAANLVPPPGWTMRLTERTGHFGMLFRPSVAAMALDALDTMRGDESAEGRPAS